MNIEIPPTMDWKWFACPGCPLSSEQAGTLTPSEIKPDSKYIIVGESPGREEVAARKPFVGYSGKLLWAKLEQLGVTRDQCSVTNAVLCLPPANYEEKQEVLSAAATCCHKRLMAEVAQAGGNILTLGKTAREQFFVEEKGESKTTLHGRWIEWNNKYVISTVHPAFILREPDSAKSMFDDIAKFVEDCPVFLPPVTYTVVNGLEHLRFVLNTLGEVVAFDLETTQINWREDEILCMVLSDGKHNYIIPGKHPQSPGDLLYLTAGAQIWELFWNSNRTFVGHNAKFDLRFLRHQLQHNSARVDFDTMLAHYCLAPTTRVLKTDLTWTEVQRLQEGDELVGFDEDDPQTMLPSIVKGTKKQLAPSYRITTARGSIICSAGHIWPCKISHQGWTAWLTTEEIYHRRGATDLMHFVDPWEVDNSRDAGYIAAMLDGEGCISIHGRQVIFSQKVGTVLNKVSQLLLSKGFTFSTQPHGGVVNLTFSGRESLRVVGSFRPLRFLERAYELLFGGWGKEGKRGVGRRKQHPEPVISIEFLGGQEVIGVETTTQTFIAEGFLTHNCLDERKGTHDLKGLSARYFNVPDYEVELKQYLTSRNDLYEKIPWDKLIEYAAMDGYCTWQLFRELDAELNRQGLYEWPFMNVLMAGNNLLLEAELRGVQIDRKHLYQVSADFETELERMKEEFFKDINPNSPMQVSAYMFGTLKLPMPKGRKIKPGSTSKEVLFHLAGTHPFVDALIRYRRISKLQSSYVNNILDCMDNGSAVHCDFKLHGTETGRLSVEDPALQTIPRANDKEVGQFGRLIKDSFIAREGYKLVVADFSQAELRVAAALSGDQFLIKVYAEDRDLHTEVTLSMYGEVWTKEQRVLCKMFNFSYLYGGSEFSFAQDSGLPIGVAKDFVKKYNATMAGLSGWKVDQANLMKKQGWVSTRTGRRRRVPFICNTNAEDARKMAFNQPDQGLASDITLLSAVCAAPKLKPLDAHILLLVHDSIIAECPTDKVVEASVILHSCMIETGTQWCPEVKWKADVEVGDRWGTVH